MNDMQTTGTHFSTVVAPFELEVLYSQIAVFHAGLESPFNDWTQMHVDQGFSWRPESVSFRTLNESGKARIYVMKPNHWALRSDSVRAIQVPFTVPESNLVEIASIIESKIVEIASGSYELLFETGLEEIGRMWCQFSFVRNKNPTARILKADEQLKVPEHLLLGAEFAS